MDALSDDGAHALTLIAFIGSVFSPYYAWSRTQMPENFCAMNVALYSPHNGRWAMTERGALQLKRDAHGLQIGPSALRWNGKVLRAEIDELCAPLPLRLRGTLALTPATVTDHGFTLDAAGRHRWWPLAPAGRIDVAFEKPKLAWSGRAYLDSNAGDVPLTRDFSRWSWSRAAHGTATRIIYDAKRLDGTPKVLALDIDAAGRVTEFAPPPPRQLGHGFWGVRRETRADAAQIVKIFEDTPFYCRSLIDTRIGDNTFRAVHETLDLERFRRRWVQALLPFRMPRRSISIT